MSDSSTTPWTIAHQAPLPMGFPRQEYWSGLPFPSLGGLSNPRIKPQYPALQADSLPSEPPGKSVLMKHMYNYIFVLVIDNLAFINGRKESDTTERMN